MPGPLPAPNAVRQRDRQAAARKSTTPAGREVTGAVGPLAGPIGTLLDQVAWFPIYTDAYLAALEQLAL